MEPRATPRISGLKKCMGWPLGPYEAPTYTSAIPSPDEGNIPVKYRPAPNYLPPLALSDPFNRSAPPGLLRETVVRSFLEDRTLTTGILLASLIVFAVSYARSPWRKLPPSPRRTPIIGNALQLSDLHWLISKDCKDRFGEVMYLDAAGSPTIVLNSLKPAVELLERRSNNYSDRPRFIMAQEILSKGLVMGFMSYTASWRRQRRAAQATLSKEAVQEYYPVLTKEATVLVSALLTNSSSSDRTKHFQRAATSAIMSVLYDYPTLISGQDTAIKGIDNYNQRVEYAATPGSFLVESFPWMMYIPERFAQWKREGLQQAAEHQEMFLRLLNRVRGDLANGGTRPSISASLILGADRNLLAEAEMAFLAGSMHSAGSGTIVSVLNWWSVAMVAFPEAQRRAQAELDAVVGRDRLPTFSDSPHLPYIHALVKETLRWRPAAPFGVPHVATREDWYEGMYIPKGTACMANIWQCNHDPAVFGDDADEFRPERFLDERGELTSGPMDPNQEGHYTYGFGQRNCVGKLLANDSLFLYVARTLWAVNFERVRDESGNEVLPDTDTLVGPGLFIHPAPFDCKVTPRFPKVTSLLAEERERWGI
ncbi:cytochrome P450 [Lactarius sanguifluus]|nr:cytochrome P450 [Lactarius sanguifluus]